MMIKRFFLAFLAVTFIFISNSYANLRDLPQITVLASASLTKPLTEIARIYSRENNVTVTVSFDEVSEQARKIDEGVAADIFISSHPSWITSVKQKGLIDVNSITNLVKNKLALVASANSRINKHIPQEGDVESKIIHLSIRTIMVIANPETTTLGLYTKQALQKIGEQGGTNIWAKIEKNELNIINAVSSENTLSMILDGDTAGIVFYSDAENNKELHILSVLDESLYEPIIYQGAVVAGKSMTNARSFLDYLKTQNARNIFRKHGLSLI